MVSSTERCEAIDASRSEKHRRAKLEPRQPHTSSKESSVREIEFSPSILSKTSHGAVSVDKENGLPRRGKFSCQNTTVEECQESFGSAGKKNSSKKSRSSKSKSSDDSMEIKFSASKSKSQHRKVLPSSSTDDISGTKSPVTKPKTQRRCVSPSVANGTSRNGLLSDSRARSRQRSKSPSVHDTTKKGGRSSTSVPRIRHRSESPFSPNAQGRSLRSTSKVRSRRREQSLAPERTRSLSVSAPRTTRTNSPPRIPSNHGSIVGKIAAKPKKSKTRSRRLEATESGQSLDEISIATSLTTIDEGKSEALHVHHASLNALVYKLKDTSLEEELVSVFKRIEDADCIPEARQAAFQANPIKVNMLKVLQNDPEVTALTIQQDKKFREIEKRFPIEFAEGLRLNLHLTSLIITDVGLDDDFIFAIATSVRDNFTLENLELANNCFSSNGLLEFCCCLGCNVSLRTIDLRNQKNSVVLLKEHERDAMEAIMSNKYIQLLEIDVATEKCTEVINLTVERNIKTPKYLDYDKKLLEHCQDEANNAEQLFQLNLFEEKLKQQYRKEMPRLWNLADIAVINKVDIVSDNGNIVSKKGKRKNLIPSDKDMPVDGSFLNSNFISNFIEEDPSSLGLMFNFSGQSALFKKFNRSHESRNAIVSKFVDALVNHTQSNDIIRIILRESGCRDDFVIALCQRCQGNGKILPKLFMLDLGMNCISDAGVAALAACLADKKSLRYLQVLILQTQYNVLDGKKTLFSLKSELLLAKALCQNLSLLRLSLKIRSLLVRRKIEGYLARNRDFLEQARTAKDVSGKIKHPRNELEQEIDKLAANDPALWRLDCSADPRFLSLKRKDILKVAKALSCNKFVTEVRLNRLELDNEFAVLLSESIEINCAVRVLSLEGNAINGTGIKAIISGLAKNNTIVELNLQQQSEAMSSDDENEILNLLGRNTVVQKLGLDIRNGQVREELAHRLSSNQQSQWKSIRRSLPTVSECSRKVGSGVQRKSIE